MGKRWRLTANVASQIPIRKFQRVTEPEELVAYEHCQTKRTSRDVYRRARDLLISRPLVAWEKLRRLHVNLGDMILLAYEREDEEFLPSLIYRISQETGEIKPYVYWILFRLRIAHNRRSLKNYVRYGRPSHRDRQRYETLDELTLFRLRPEDERREDWWDRSNREIEGRHEIEERGRKKRLIAACVRSCSRSWPWP